MSFQAKDQNQWCECYFALEQKFSLWAILLFIMFSHAAAFDPLDPFGNITLKWDVISWTPDGYVAVVTMNNFQMYRHIHTPGWTLGWGWAKKEVIWSMVGAQATEQGDCSKFKGNAPHCCLRNPIIVDLLPGVPYNQQISNCCKGGVLASWGQDPSASVSAFQVSVGLSGTSNKTVKLPKNFTLLGPGLGYTCGPAKIVPSTVFLTADQRRKTQSLITVFNDLHAVTWNVTCTYSQFLASKNPSCCVSFSSFYNDTITPCQSCACGCHNKKNCIMNDSKRLNTVGINTPRKDNAPLIQCTQHMCPIRVHWHVKINYKDYWRVKMAVTNFNYRMNYTQWTLVAQHPNLNDITQVFSFDYKPLVPYQSISQCTLTFTICFFFQLNGEKTNKLTDVNRPSSSITLSSSQGWNLRLMHHATTFSLESSNVKSVMKSTKTYALSGVLGMKNGDDTAMFFGMKFYNDLLMEAGPLGNVQSELLLRKDKNTFTLKHGWAFPRKIYFNGDECMLPHPDAYPFLPNSAQSISIAFLELVVSMILMILFTY
ncbi:unnamed protein product [Ilex paraguariensis]|uniref:COBRA C-terminal domain-containing protein n=1 Tax=Ilex paraguariensis TaxID=185542 RepID=A0ABC8T7P9_9AQUA